MPAEDTAPALLHMGAAEWGLLLLLSLLWGASFLFGRMAVLELPTLTVVLARVLIAAAVLWLVVAATGAGAPRGATGWWPYVVMGLINNVIPFSLIFGGQSLGVGAGLAAVLNATTPLFAGLFAHCLTSDEKLNRHKIAGMLVGLLGVVILIGPDALTGLGDLGLAQVMVVGGAVSYGLASVWGRRFRRLPPLTSAAAQLTASTAMLLPAVLVVDRPWTLALPSAQTIVALVALAVLSTALAYVIFFSIIRRAGATNVMLVTLLIPPSAILLGALFLGEVLGAGEIAGALVIGLALLLIDGRVLRHLGRPGAVRP